MGLIVIVSEHCDVDMWLKTIVVLCCHIFVFTHKKVTCSFKTRLLSQTVHFINKSYCLNCWILQFKKKILRICCTVCICIMLPATSLGFVELFMPGVVHTFSCNIVMGSYHSHDLLNNCKSNPTGYAYPNSWNFSWIKGYWPAFYIIYVHASYIQMSQSWYLL